MKDAGRATRFFWFAGVWFGFLVGVLDAWGSALWMSPLSPDLPWLYPIIYPLFFSLISFCVIGILAALRVARRFFWLCLFLSAASLWALLLSASLRNSSGRGLILILSIGAVLGTAFAWVFERREAGFRLLVSRTLPIFLIYMAGCAAIPLLHQVREDRGAALASAAGPSQPNVLLIIVDSLRADHLSTYGYSRETSPHLSALAAQGVLFESAIAAAPWTLPSHASMMTGLYPNQHGAEAVGDPEPLDGRFLTIAETFKERRYLTAAFSANYGLFSRRFGFERGFTHFDDVGASVVNAGLETPLLMRLRRVFLQVRGLGNTLPARQSAGDINEHALQWIDRYSGHPFFVTLNYLDVHYPYLAPPAELHRYSQDSPPPRPPGDIERWFLRLTPAQVKQEEDEYDGAITYVDSEIAALLAQLERRKLMDSTIVIITSDHGEGFKEHKFFGHANSLYPELLRVPLIVIAKGLPRGMRVSQPVSTTALPATMLGLVNAHGTNPFRGPSLAALWSSGSGAITWPYPQSQLEPQGRFEQFLNYKSPMQSLVTPDWHLIVGGAKKVELFDRSADASEVTNLATSPSLKPVVDALAAELEGASDSETGREVRVAGRPGPAADKAAAIIISRDAIVARRKARAADPARHKKSSDELLRALGYIP